MEPAIYKVSKSQRLSRLEREEEHWKLIKMHRTLIIIIILLFLGQSGILYKFMI